MIIRTTRAAALLAGTTALAVAGALPTFAQDDDTFDLGEIVFDVPGANPVGEDLNPFTLSGMKAATEITDVPQSVSVVGREAFEKQTPRKVDQVLQDVAGVQSQLYGYDSDTNWFYIRGFNASDTGAYMDGLSLFSYGFGTFYIDPFLLERVEVLKGPSSMLYGASSPGGIVNYVSRLPDGSEGSALSFDFDSEGRAAISGETAGKLGEDLSYRLGAKLTRQDGHGMFEEGFEGVAFGGVTKAFDDGSRLTLHLSYTDMDEDHVGGQFLPYYGTAAPGPFGYFDDYYNGGNPDVDSYDREQLIATAIYRRDLGGWDMSNTFRFGFADVEETYAYPYGFTSGQVPTPGANVNRLVFAHNSYATIFQNDLNFSREFGLGGSRHQVLLGVDARRYKLDEQQASETGTPLSPTAPDYSIAQPAVGAPYIDGVRTQEQIGIYAQDQIRFGDGWIATINGRYDKVYSKFDNRSGADLSRTDDAFSGRVALSKKIGDFTPYATAGTYFNPQALALESVNADPETGRQIEVGLKWQPNAHSLVTVSAFDVERKDVAQSFVNGGVFDSRTLGKLSSTGFEVEADVELMAGLRMTAAYTNLDVKIDEFASDPTIVGKTPQSVVEEFGSLQFAYSPMAVPDLELRLGARYQGASWADNANTLRVGDAWLFDAGATWDFADDWSANLNVTNIADNRYTASCQTSFGISSCWQGEGRVITLGVTRSF